MMVGLKPPDVIRNMFSLSFSIFVRSTYFSDSENIDPIIDSAIEAANDYINEVSTERSLNLQERYR